jgi:hypothetical protein
MPNQLLFQCAAGLHEQTSIDWLSAVARPNKQPGGQAIATHFEAFRNDVPAICAKLSLVPNELTFVDYGNVVGAWLTLPQFGP